MQVTLQGPRTNLSSNYTSVFITCETVGVAYSYSYSCNIYLLIFTFDKITICLRLNKYSFGCLTMKDKDQRRPEAFTHLLLFTQISFLIFLAGSRASKFKFARYYLSRPVKTSYESSNKKYSVAILLIDSLSQLGLVR